ncbi:hypothetical protein QDX12_08700 [Escherichia coli]|nr:hypothetical protein QDX12_08700 [Escherichia coli]WHG68000.1 hypothetical protein QDW94_16535 [Escherichia coli]WHG70631.1 hypothetical protein QDW94_08670 [Escherichia coli]
MKLWPTLGVAFLLIAAWGTSMRLSWSLGRENARNEAQASALKSTVDTLNIISTGVQDMQQVLAQLRVENQQRNQDGEARREQLRNDIAKDECAHALPDARFTDRLRRHAERATASAVSPAYTADADHTGNAAPFPDTPTWGNLGIWGDRLLDALETCNADKRAIELLEQRRLQRLNNEDNNHAEN